MEVETICRYNLPICVVIFNNDGIYRGTDVNNVNSDPATTVFVKGARYDKMMEAFGGVGVNATSPDELKRAVNEAMDSGKPTLIACKTTIGYGAPNKAGTAKVHGEALGADELKAAKDKLGISQEAFSVPDDVLKAWRAAGARGAAAKKEWQEAFGALSNRKQSEFQRRMKHERPAGLAKAFRAHKKALLEKPLTAATRKSSEAAIEAIIDAIPEFVAGSADLTGSNNNKAKSAVAFSHKTPKGRFIHYGIREHGMAAAMNGLYLHGGFAPNGATFLVFTDYARGAMRLSALMGTGVVYVMTHDSIGLGEDGPTHQPVEHLAALRAMPNMRVFRPCDSIEVAECWELALNRTDGPTVLALTRQNLPQLRTNAPNDNPCAHGAYELVAAQGEAKVSLFASGSEVEIAVAAQKQLAERGIASRVVSVPSLELLLAQPAERQKAIIGNAPVKIAIEAAVRWGWDAVIGHDGEFVGMHGFGASAPAKDLFKHFGITAEAAVNAALKRLG
ncbi:Transketolase 2 [subsurface metagenome]